MANLMRTFKPSLIQSSISFVPRSTLRSSNQKLNKLSRPLLPLAGNHLSIQRHFSTPKKEQPEVNNDEIKANWKELNISKPIKIVLIILLSILGTMETIFYFKLFMRRFFLDEEKSEEETSSETK